MSENNDNLREDFEKWIDKNKPFILKHASIDIGRWWIEKIKARDAKLIKAIEGSDVLFSWREFVIDFLKSNE